MALLSELIGFIFKASSPVVKHWSSSWAKSQQQASTVRLSIGSTLTGIQQLGDAGMTTQEMRQKYKRLATAFFADTHRLDVMTDELPAWLQRKQIHVLSHARWLANYLESHITDNEGEFFLFWFDMSAGQDDELQKLMLSLRQLPC